ncbi:MAG: DUF6282 family protein [Candidatus Bathyarchaeia archaeon]
MSIELPPSDRELLEGVIDLHVHAMPCIFDRPFDEVALARQARDAGYRAILFKCHHAINADRAYLIRRIVPGIEVFGGIVLNHPVGGINPEAVDAAIGFGAKEVWMPALHAMNHIEVVGMPSYPRHVRVRDAGEPRRGVRGITILTDEGELIPQVHEILGLIADADIILGTSHLSLEEVTILIGAARAAGVKKVLVTHPGWEATAWSVEEQAEMAEKGAFLEHCFSPCMPYGARYDPRLIAEAIRRVGAHRCVMATDVG